MPRFVLLRHEMPPTSNRPSHWDLMLEHDGRLWTWAVSEPLRAGMRISAERLPDHRIHYLTYEGPVSQDRGTVRRCAAGTYAVRHQREDRLEVELQAPELRGVLTLARVPESANEARWEMTLSSA